MMRVDLFNTLFVWRLHNLCHETGRVINRVAFYLRDQKIAKKWRFVEYYLTRNWEKVVRLFPESIFEDFLFEEFFCGIIPLNTSIEEMMNFIEFSFSIFMPVC